MAIKSYAEMPKIDVLPHCDQRDDITWKIRSWELFNEDLTGEAMDAIISGNTRQVESIMGEFPDETAYHSAMRTAIKERYAAGEIDYNTAIQYLVKYGGKGRNEAYWIAEEWKYEAETGENFKKYDAFLSAVETGKNLKAVIKKYTDHGVSCNDLAGEITEHFKPLYKAMTKSERVAIKGYLLNAYTLLGYDRTKKSKDIDKWCEN